MSLLPEGKLCQTFARFSYSSSCWPECFRGSDNPVKWLLVTCSLQSTSCHLLSFPQFPWPSSFFSPIFRSRHLRLLYCYSSLSKVSDHSESLPASFPLPSLRPPFSAAHRLLWFVSPYPPLVSPSQTPFTLFIPPPTHLTPFLLLLGRWAVSVHSILSFLSPLSTHYAPPLITLSPLLTPSPFFALSFSPQASFSMAATALLRTASAAGIR